MNDALGFLSDLIVITAVFWLAVAVVRFIGERIGNLRRVSRDTRAFLATIGDAREDQAEDELLDAVTRWRRDMDHDEREGL